MSDTFLITGFPRSRTGWLANLFTYGRCFCFHDGLQFGKDRLLGWIKDYQEKYQHVGNADSGACYAWPDKLPFDKLIVVQRNQAEAEASFIQYFTRHPYPHQQKGKPGAQEVHEIFSKFKELMDRAVCSFPRGKVRVVSFGELNHMDTAAELWDFISPEEPFNRERWMMLDKLRVNPASEKVVLWES